MAIDLVGAFNAALPGVGAFSFGSMLGWVTYRTLRRQDAKPTLADLGVIASTLLGAVISALFQLPQLFGAYCTGLGVGFFGYLLVSVQREAAWRKEPARRTGQPTPDAPLGGVSVDAWMSRSPGGRGPGPDDAATGAPAEVSVTTSATRGDTP